MISFTSGAAASLTAPFALVFVPTSLVFLSTSLFFLKILYKRALGLFLSCGWGLPSWPQIYGVSQNKLYLSLAQWMA